MRNAIDYIFKNVFFLFLLALSSGYSWGQLNMQFRVVSVSSDVDDMDPAGSGANGGASDPQWDYQMTDVPFANNSSGFTNLLETNCPGVVAVNDVFFNQNYAAGCNTPTEYTFEWSGVEADVPAVVPNAVGGASASQIVAIPALSLTYPSGGWLPLGTYTVTAPGTDCGATGTVTWSIDVEYMTVGATESILPTITCPVGITQNIDPLSCSAVVAGIAPVAVVDNCGVSNQTWSLTGATVGNSPPFGIFDASGQAFNVGVTTVTYTVQDNSANAATCNFTVTVIDNENPTISCPTNFTQVNDPGNCSAVINGITPTANDNCSIITQTWVLSGATVASSPLTGINDASGQVFNLGTTTVTYEVTDVSGNTAQCSFDITVTDSENPIIACPADITVSNTVGSCGAIVNYTAPIGTDNCPGVTTALFSGPASGSTFPIGTTTVTYEVTDASSNTTQCSFDVTVTDNENPTITCPADITVPNTVGSCGAIVNYVAPIGTDNCPGSITTLFSGPASGSTFPIGTTTVIYEVTDASGNTAQCSFDVIVNDTEPPVISCPANITVPNNLGTCERGVGYITPVGTDNCPGTVTNLIAGFASGALFPVGITTITYEAIDASGNTAQCSFDVTVTDSENPTISCPANITVPNTAGSCDAIVNYAAPVGIDNCPGSITTLFSGPASGSSFPVGITTVIYEVADASGNTVQCSFDIAVTDNENPTIACPADINVPNSPGLCGAVVNYTAPVGIDNCPGSITALFSGPASGSTFPIGTTTVIYEVVDASSNTAQCSFDVTVTDSENPTIVCPADINVPNSLGLCGAIVNYAAPLGTDNCPGSITTLFSGPASGSTFPIGTTTVTYEVTDASGNAAQCSFDVTVTDSENPTITCPANITVPNNAGSCGAIVTYSTPIFSDNCLGGFSSLIAGFGSGSLFPIGTTTVTYQVTDASGNTAQCSFDVTVTDSENPTISCPANITVPNTVGSCDAIVNYTAPLGIDNCPGAITSMITGFASGSLFPIGTTSVTYEVIDASANATQCSFDVTVTDSENPTIACPANISVPNTAGSCDAIVNYTAPAGIDNCPGSITTLFSGPASGSVFPIGTTTVTYEVTDASANTAQCSFDVTVTDSENPTIACPANITVPNTVGSCDAIVNYTAPVGIDNCPGSITTLFSGPASGGTFPIGTTTVTYEVADASGNTTQCSFDVTVTDSENPTIACPANITVPNTAGSCDAIVNYTAPVGIDNCPGSMTTLFSGPASGGTFPIGTTTVTYEVADASGNTTQCSFDVTVTDSENPTIACPANISVPNTVGSCDAIVNYTAPVGIDNCPGSITTLFSGPASGSLFPVGTTTVTYEVSDASGNTAQCSFDVTVTDTEVPSLTCPTNITVSNSAGLCGAIVNYATPVGTDNCAGLTNTLISGQASGSLFPIGTTTVTYEVADISGNTAQCSFDVSVSDTENPTISCPGNINVSNALGTCGALVTYSLPVGSDNCTGYFTGLTAGFASNSVFPVGTTTVTYTITDAASNTGQCSFDVTVTDSENPTITCPGNLSVPNTLGSCDAIVNYVTPVGLDNCPGGVTNILSGFASGGNFPVGTTTVTYEIIDLSGNSAQCSFDVTVNDTENPVIVCPGDITVPNIASGCGAIVNYTAPVGTDNCAGAVTSLISGLPNASFFPIGSTTVLYEVIDAAGNNSQCSFDVIVNDLEMPTITCPANITVPNDFGTCGALVSYTTPVGSDNCPGVVTSLTAGFSSNSIFPIGTTTVTYDAIDAAGNSVQCSFDVTVTDSENPTIACPANITVPNTTGSCGAIVNYAAPVGSDNCVGSTTTTLISGLASGSTFPVGTTTITYEVIDASGNSAQCSFDVIVIDSEIPSISCPANMNVPNTLGSCDAVVNYTTPVGIDNCAGSITTLISGLASGSTFPVGTTTITYEVADVAGNTAQCSFDVSVVDSEIPSITCPADINVPNSPGLCGAIVNYTAPVGTDNCPGVTTNLIAGLASGGTFPIGTTTITYEVADASGNTVQCSFDITVNDTEIPVLNCPANIVTGNTIGSCGSIVNYAIPVGTDNCPGLPTNLIAGLTSGAIFPIGTTTVTYEIIDLSGNSAQCSFDVTVNDIENPTIACPADIIVGNTAGNCDAVVNYAVPVGSDNCGVVSTIIIAGFPSGSLFPIGTTTVTYQVTDVSGNSSQCSFDVTVNDTEIPTIACPADITANNDLGTCGSTIGYATPVGTDNCPGSITNLISGLPSGSFFPGGVTAVTFEVIDVSGNTSQCSFNITIVDTEIPIMTCPTDIVANNDLGLCGAIVSYPTPTVSDNCSGGIISVISGFASGSLFPIGTTTVTLEVSDVSGNTAQCSFDVTINDTEGPNVICPGNQTVSANANCEFVLADYISMSIATDNCGSFTLTQTPAAGTLLTAGATVTISGVDQYGNTGDCNFQVTAADNISPILTCPSTHTEYLSGTCDYLLDDLISVISVVENCNSYTYSQLPAAGTLLTSDTVVTLNVVDFAGNSATCNFTLVVADTTKPIVTCPPNDVEVFFSSICDFVVQDYTGLISTFDNCGFATLIQNPLPGTAIAGNTPITFTGTDINGNIEQCSFNIIPKDTVPPTIGCPGAQVGYVNDSCEFVVQDYTSLAIIVTTCEVITVNQTPPVGTVMNTNFTLSLSGTDASGNVNFCTFPVVLEDTISPELICPPDVYSCTEVVDYLPPIATDNCGVLSINRIAGPASGSIFPLGPTLITYEATDLSGNIDTCSFVINVMPVPQLSVSTTDISCNGLQDGSLDVTISNGTPPFNYLWSNGSTTEDITNLIAGTYTFIVLDKFGCTDTITEVISEPGILIADYDVSPVGCYGSNEGYINLSNIFGGTFPYNFVWSPSVGIGTSANDLSPGSYNISIVDGNGCSLDTTIVIIESDSILIDAELSIYDYGFNISEEGGSDGYIDLLVTGGTIPYQYVWDNGDMTAYIDGLSAGTYSVIIIDDLGCETEGSFTLTEPYILTVSNGLSPNGDGLNDVLYIDNIEKFPNSHLIIMNRWGDVVYEKIGYQNDWDGTPNKGMVIYGNKVPEGSYFYRLDPADVSHEKLSGYIIVN